MNRDRLLATAVRRRVTNQCPDLDVVDRGRGVEAIRNMTNGLSWAAFSLNPIECGPPVVPDPGL